jgi:hypothetical protein
VKFYLSKNYKLRVSLVARINRLMILYIILIDKKEIFNSIILYSYLRLNDLANKLNVTIKTLFYP